jgi:serine/threonine protein kinase
LSILQNKGICHRDIKPQNILYHKGRYILCDFDEVIITKEGKLDKDIQEIVKEI